ncbi:MAG: hypothetical protein K6C94_02915 [Candidatus Gastranaerophilales bacterium]|nr:hypothetical protein [Candidatus Gastranaerophilales bacterium]
MKILVVGSDANAYSIAKKMSENENVDAVFAAPGFDKISDFAQNIDIQETNLPELLDFVLENEISLTVVTSVNAIEQNIAEFFADARRLVFAPCAEAANVTLYKSLAKKLMYRLKIPTMKFGIFDRENQAVDYVAMSRKPLVIKKDRHQAGDFPVFAASFPKAKAEIEKSLVSPENKIVIEDYTDAKEVAMYFLTDGYTALPIGNCSSNDPDFAFADSVVSPDNYISDEMERKILNEVVYPVIDDISARGQAYCGILGVDLFVDGNCYNVIEFNPFFKQMHLQTILPLIKSDIYDLFIAAASGSLSDEYERIDFCNCAAVSKITNNIDDSKIPVLDDANLSVARTSASNYILTQIARISAKAKENLEENLEFLRREDLSGK